MLIEVVVSGLLLALLAVGLFGAFDGSARVSVRNKERATSARLAQEDQERLRGLPITDISNLRESSPKLIGGVTYTVASRADWVADAAGNTTCAAGDAKADYLKIQTTVTPSKAGAKPVVVESMLNPKLGTFGAGTGSLAVEVLNRDDAGVAGLPVTITGPLTDTDATNADGCAFFGYEPTGNYTISLLRRRLGRLQGRHRDQRGHVDLQRRRVDQEPALRPGGLGHGQLRHVGRRHGEARQLRRGPPRAQQRPAAARHGHGRDDREADGPLPVQGRLRRLRRRVRPEQPGLLHGHARQPVARGDRPARRRPGGHGAPADDHDPRAQVGLEPGHLPGEPSRALHVAVRRHGRHAAPPGRHRRQRLRPRRPALRRLDASASTTSRRRRCPRRSGAGRPTRPCRTARRMGRPRRSSTWSSLPPAAARANVCA